MFGLTPRRRGFKPAPQHYNPFKEMEDMMTRFLPDYPDYDTATAGEPSFNMKKEGDNIVVEAAAPGMEKDDLEVNLKENVLTISGKHEEKHEEKTENYYHREFKTGSFSRSVTLPERVDPAGVKGKYENGVLKVILPIMKEKTEDASRIEIE